MADFAGANAATGKPETERVSGRMDFGSPRRLFRQGVLNTLLIVLASLATTTAWAGGPKVFYNIPAGDAAKTLQIYLQQTRIEMLYLTEKVRGRQTNAVSGNLEASDALERMLAGTDLEFTFTPDFSFATVKTREETQSGSAEPPSVEVAKASTQVEAPARTQEATELFGNQNLEEVVVTGTLIRGVLDIMSPLEFVTKRDMKKTAYATVQDALQELPMNFGGGPSEDLSGTGNFTRGSSVNLRGLGAGATLVLVNGHRQPYSGYDGDFVDVSSIAWNAVDRIEVLPDGAAALYGSDAIAGVVNVIMRKDFDGAETQMRFGSAAGGAQEKLIGQLLGKTWDSGNLLFSYQYSERTALDASERYYAASTDKRSIGGTDHRSYLSNPGNILDPRTFTPAYGLPASQNGTSLEVSDLLPGSINLYNTYNSIQLLPDRKLHSFFLDGKQQLGDRVELFAEGRFSHRDVQQNFFAADQLLIVPPSNAFYVNPYPGVPFVAVAYNFADDLGPLSLKARANTFSGTVGADTKISDSWNVKLSESFGRETMHYSGQNSLNQVALRAALADSNPLTAFDPFGDGSNTNAATIESFRDTLRLLARSEIKSTNLIADGTVFTLPTGAAKLAIGGEWRDESLDRGSTVMYRFDRSVQSAFAELAVPLVGNPTDPRATPRLELSLAGRYEKYSDFGSTANPKVGLRWAPSKAFKFRTSWGTSFKAPKLVDLYDTSNNANSIAPLRDPKSANGTSLVLALEGSNPDLREERASTWTAGFDFAPEFAKGATLSLTYYSINYDHRILIPGPAARTDILLQESQWSSVINRVPTRDEIKAACESPVYRGTTVSQCEAAPIGAIVDFRVRNLAETRVRGLDMKLDQILRTRFGRFDLGLNGGYVFSLRQAASDTSPLVSVLDTVGNPASFRMRGSLDWHQRDWDRAGFGASATIDRVGAYTDPGVVTTRPVADFTTVNLRLSYRTSSGTGTALDDLEFGLNASNVFDRAPPFVDRDAGYDQANAEPFGRVVSFSVQKTW